MAINTLYDYYSSQGQALPSVQQRQSTATQAGIQNYSGTADQNNQLLAYLQKQPSSNSVIQPSAGTGTYQSPSSLYTQLLQTGPTAQTLGLQAKQPTASAPTTTLPQSQTATTNPPAQPTQQPTSQQTQLPQQQNQQQNPTTNPNEGLYAKLIQQLGSQNINNNPAYLQSLAAYNDAVGKLSQFNQNLATQYGNIESTPIPLEFQQGREQVLARQAASQQAALQGAVQQQQTAVGQAQTGQGLTQQALQAAAGLAAPQLAGFNQQAFNPLTGQFGSGTGGTSALSQLPPQAQSAVQSYAQQVQNGSMTRADAESRLSAYGVAGTNALNEVLGNSFNTNASNASAQTTAQGQQIKTFADSANAALDKLQTDFVNLPNWQKTGVPGTVAIGQWIGQVLGNDKLSIFQTTLHDARAQLSGVLSTAGGMTPTGAQDTANTYLPDNMTPDMLASKIAAAKALIQQKVQAFTSSGQQNNATTNTTGGSIWSF